MIQIITGVPGGGKTYNAVSKMLALLDKGQIVVHNIHGFNDPRAIELDFGQVPLDADSLFKYFDMVRVQKGADADTIITVFIDEAQRFWPYEYKDARGVFFFDYHRHHGLDIFLITQDIKKITPKVSSLAEMEIRAVKPMFQLTPGFTYNLISGGEIFGKERLSKKKEVFESYTSFLAGSGSQKKSKYRWAIPVFIVFTVVMYFVLSYSLNNSFTKLSPQTEQKQTISSPSGSVVSSPPQQIGKDLGAGVSSSDDYKPSVQYMGPAIKSHRANYVTIKNDDDFEEEILFSDFVNKYSPMVYGYSYFHAPSKNKLIIMDKFSNKIIYPVDNDVPRIQFIKNENPVSVSSSPSAADVLDAMPSDSPGWGYSSEDRKLLRYLDEVSRGLNPASFSGAVPPPQTKVLDNSLTVP